MEVLRRLLIITTVAVILLSTQGCTKGKLKIESDIEGGEIFIDNQKRGEMGNGSVTFTVSEGSHEVRIFKPVDDWSYIENVKSIFVGPDSIVEITLNGQTKLTPAAIKRNEELAALEKERKEEKAKRIEKEREAKIARIEEEKSVEKNLSKQHLSQSIELIKTGHDYNTSSWKEPDSVYYTHDGNMSFRHTRRGDSGTTVYGVNIHGRIASSLKYRTVKVQVGIKAAGEIKSNCALLGCVKWGGEEIDDKFLVSVPPGGVTFKKYYNLANTGWTTGIGIGLNSAEGTYLKDNPVITTRIAEPIKSPRSGNPIVFDQQLKESQKLLSKLGYYGGEIDGMFGPATSKAIVSFQEAQNLDRTGKLNEETRKTLDLLSKKKQESIHPPKKQTRQPGTNNPATNPRQHLWSDCSRPSLPIPSLPNGTTASMDEMVVAQKAVKEFVRENTKFTECVGKATTTENQRSDTNDPVYETDYRKIIEIHNAVVDEMKALSSKWSSTMSAFKAVN